MEKQNTVEYEIKDAADKLAQFDVISLFVVLFFSLPLFFLSLSIYPIMSLPFAQCIFDYTAGSE